MEKTEKLRVLLLEPNENLAQIIRTSLASCNICMDHAASMQEATKLLSGNYRVVVADYNMNNGVTGTNYLAIFKARNRDIKTIIYNHEGNDSSGNEINKVFKPPFEMKEIVHVIKLYCIEGVQPEIFEALFDAMKKMKEKLDSFGDLKTTVDTTQKIMNSFIKANSHTAFKIVAGNAVVITLIFSILLFVLSLLKIIKIG